MKTLTPEDFRFDLLHHARMLQRYALAESSGRPLDPKTSQWVIRREAWNEFRQAMDFLTVTGAVQINSRAAAWTLLGLPVRITVDDHPDTPMVQLVMEPMLYHPRTTSARSP